VRSWSSSAAGVEQVDDLERFHDRSPPHGGYAPALEQRHRVGRPQALQRDAQTPLRLQAEDAVHRRCPHPDQVHPSPPSLAQRAVIERRDPQLGHQVSAGELGQHACVDLVGLARQRRDVYRKTA
jgi:hypothetical protein